MQLYHMINTLTSIFHLAYSKACHNIFLHNKTIPELDYEKERNIDVAQNAVIHGLITTVVH